MEETGARPSSNEVTRLIEKMRDGSNSAAQRLLPLVYHELRALAQSYFDRQRRDHTLQPTALVHEAFIRLVGNPDMQWEGRSHFLAVAAKAMRNVLADHARARRRLKRSPGGDRVTLSGIGGEEADRAFDALDIDEALDELARLNERHAQIVELRFFGGQTIAEAARVLGIAERTVRSEWRLTRAWLRQRLGAGESA